MIGKGPQDFTQAHEYTDFRGNVIREGDTVVRAALSGRSCQLDECTVVGIASKDHLERRWHWVWDSITYAELQDDPNRRVVDDPPEIVQHYKVQIIPTGRRARWDQHWKQNKPVWVMAEQVAKV